jgi:hypothetical protein
MAQIGVLVLALSISAARDAIDQYAPQHPDYDHLLMGYNNDPKTTFADIQKVLDLTEAAISKRLPH